MREALTRAVIAAPVIIALPVAFTELRPRPRRMALAAILMLAALAPYLSAWRSWAAVVLVVTASAVVTDAQDRNWRIRLAVIAIVTAAVAAVIDEAAARGAFAQIADSRDVVVVLGGYLVAVFLSGELIGRWMHPFARKLHEAPQGIERAGRVIGWLERTLLFGLIVGGAPDAAAIVIAAKSVARFPSFSEERFAEYYLIGTLLSFLSALALGVGVRAALGLPPLPSTRA